MAQNRRKGTRRTETGRTGAAVASAPTEDVSGAPDERVVDDRAKPEAQGPTRTGTGAPSRKFFEIYKRGQGYYTRMGTVIGGAVIIAGGMNYLWDQLGVFQDSEQIWTLYLRVGVPLVMGLVFGLLLFWLTGSNRKSCDFLIATEGEMKKVSWSTRREVIGSTKVVILFTVLLAILLFVVDLAFLLFFSSIRVVKVPPEILRRIFGMD
jgi:preprotein translocase subunit SecE